jgi:hypothetical protein
LIRPERVWDRNDEPAYNQNHIKTGQFPAPDRMFRENNLCGRNEPSSLSMRNSLSSGTLLSTRFHLDKDKHVRICHDQVDLTERRSNTPRKQIVSFPFVPRSHESLRRSSGSLCQRPTLIFPTTTQRFFINHL